MHRLTRHSVLAACLLTACAAPLLAQPPTVQAGAPPDVSTVRTTRDEVIVWRRNPSLVIAVLPQDVTLEALSYDGQWYEVRVPEEFAGAGGAVGFVYSGHVELSGPPPPARAARPAPAAGDDRQPPGAARRARPPAPALTVGVRGYGRVGWEWFLASDSFDAILGQNGGVLYGGGGQVIFRRLFVDVSLERFEKTGERVFVFEGEVFPLGTPDRITLTPITVTAGWRFPSSERVTPYVGGGLGSLRFQETSDFADAGENVDERFTSYHALVGAEYAVTRWLFVAGEFRFTTVPDALGAPGISGEFDESNLGGYDVGVKVLAGF